MKQGSEANNQQPLWARVVMRKWLNMGGNEPDYRADPDDDNEDDPQSESDDEGWGKQTRFGDSRGEEAPIESNEFLPRLRRQKSLTFRSQYISKKELRVCVGTWNVGGKLPPDDLDIDDWVGINEPADIYVLGRIIWLGDLNYRINLSYEKTRDFISKKQWSKLIEKDQLTKELEKGVFHGWSEGALNFPPTYKYEINSDKYCGEDPKVGRRIPSWCDRILSYGLGMRLLRYGRNELKFSDHRPVTATYMTEVEVFSPRKLQKALTFTDAEIENEEVMANLGPLYEF